jgi:hypothetical protein
MSTATKFFSVSDPNSVHGDPESASYGESLKVNADPVPGNPLQISCKKSVTFYFFLIRWVQHC